MGGNVSSFAKSAIHGAAHSAPFPGVSLGGDVLIIIIQLCEMVALNRYVSYLSQYNQIFQLVHRSAARYLAQKCKALCTSLGQYEELPFPKRTVKYRDHVFRSVVCPSTIHFTDDL